MLQNSVALYLLLTACLVGGLAVSTVTAASLPVPTGRRAPFACPVQMNRLMAAAWIAAGFLALGPLAGGTLLLVALGIAMNRAAVCPVTGPVNGNVSARVETLAGASLAANATLTLALSFACVVGLAA